MMCSLLLWARGEARQGLHRHREIPRRDDGRLSTRACRLAREALDRHGRLRHRRRRLLLPAESLKSELAPVEDRGVILGVFVGPRARRWSIPTSTPASSRASMAAPRMSSATSSCPATRREPGHFLRRPDRLEASARAIRSPWLGTAAPEVPGIPGAGFPGDAPRSGRARASDRSTS